MKIIIILLKIGIILSYISTIKMIYDFSKKEHAKLELDLLSRLEVCAVIGINLVGLIAVIDEKTYAFTCGLCCIGILLALFEKYRFVLAGEKNVLLKGKVYALKDLKKLGTGLLTLKVYLRSKPKPMQIYVPLTSSDVMKNKIESKIYQESYMKQISLLIKPASSLCNLRCKYCFYSDVSHNRKEESMGIMQEDIMHALIDKSLSMPVEQVNYCFQGGEPTCAGLEYFKNFIEYVNKKNTSNKIIKYSIQTNGTLLNDSWIKLFKDNNFLVGISIDGFIKNHDYYRKDAEGKGTLKNILFNIRRMNNAKIEYNILTVLTKTLSKKPKELYDFYKQNDFQYVQIIPCLPSLNHNETTDIFSLSPKEFSSFYKVFFDLWFEDYRKGNYMSVTLFDNLIPMYKGIYPQQCGMLGKCQMQIVVEGNGNVYPCDFYVLDQYCCGNIVTDSIEEMVHGEVAKKFIQEPRKKCAQCSTCQFINICHGNCKRLSECYYDENYCGYKEFLEYSKNKMIWISQQML